MSTRAERITARTDRVLEVDGQHRNRYRGQPRRGQLTAAAKTDADFAQAVALLLVARPEVLAALSPETLALPVYQRRELLAAALAKVALVVRFLEEILDRHRFDEKLAALAPVKGPAPKPKHLPVPVKQERDDQLDLFKAG